MTNRATKDTLIRMKTNQNNSVSHLSMEQPIMLIFLRHFGCTFCREALSELSVIRSSIEKLGVHLVFVHMSDNEIAERYFDRYNLKDAEHVSDPECEYYAAFGLVKGNFRQLFGLSTWINGFQRGLIEGHGLGKRLGDDFQMPGVFVIYEQEIRESYIHKLASDKPDYEKLAECCVVA